MNLHIVQIAVLMRAPTPFPSGSRQGYSDELIWCFFALPNIPPACQDTCRAEKGDLFTIWDTLKTAKQFAYNDTGHQEACRPVRDLTASRSHYTCAVGVHQFG